MISRFTRKKDVDVQIGECGFLVSTQPLIGLALQRIGFRLDGGIINGTLVRDIIENL